MRERAAFTSVLRSRKRRGSTIVELVATFLILAFVTSGTVGLYYVGTRQQRGGRFYTLAQTDLREGIRRITRTVRHGSSVVSGNAGEITVAVPQTAPGEKIRIYQKTTNGAIYAEPVGAGATGSSIVMVDAPATLSIASYQTGATGTGTATTDVTTSGPTTATEVQFTISATRGGVTTTSVAYVQLRNANYGF